MNIYDLTCAYSVPHGRNVVVEGTLCMLLLCVCGDHKCDGLIGRDLKAVLLQIVTQQSPPKLQTYISTVLTVLSLCSKSTSATERNLFRQAENLVHPQIKRSGYLGHFKPCCFIADNVEKIWLSRQSGRTKGVEEELNSKVGLSLISLFPKFNKRTTHLNLISTQPI